MTVIQAANLCPGNIVILVEGNPNVRGTITQVHRFGNANAQKNANYRPIPLGMQRARAEAEAEAEEGCYANEDGNSLSITIGNRHITLHNDTKVQVWVPANKVNFDFPVLR